MVDLRLRDFFVDIYEPMALRGVSENTLRLYGCTLRVFGRHLGRLPRLSDLNDFELNRFARARRSGGASPGTINRDLGALLALWRWAHRQNYVEKWPLVALEKTPKRSPVAWQREELTRLMQAARSCDRDVGIVPGRVWWPALLLLLWDTGERITAAMAVRREQIDTVRRWVTFAAETRKGRGADNTLPIAEDTAVAIDVLLGTHGDSYVFHWPYSETYIYRRYEKLLEAAGLPKSRGHKFHCIRKTTASYYEAAGGNATELLGHSTRRITKRYLDPRIVRPQPAVDLLFRPDDDGAGGHTAV